MAQFGWAYVGAVSPPVQPPAPTSESVLSGSNFTPKTFGAFTDPDGLINTYQAVTTNSTGSTSWSGTGLGPYTATSSDGDAGTLSLNALDSSGNTLSTAIHSYERGIETSVQSPTPPSPTSETTLSGINFSNKTFGSFTDPDSVIASYSSVTTNATGSTSWSGSGLGPYTATSSDGDAGTLSLNALDGDGDVVATAIHSYERNAPDPSEPPQPPSPTSESTLSGVNFSNKTFGAFTDPDSVIVSYSSVTTNATGSTSWSGTGLGPYSATSSDGDTGTLSLNAIDVDGDVVATAVHSYGRASPSGTLQPSLSVSGRADGEAYNVSAGARSLSITATSGSTLSTTVELASTGLAITVTGSTTTTPNWTAPAAISGGDAYQVKVEATKDGLTGTVSFTERVAGTGLQDIALDEIDLTDGTWTLSDPDSLVDTVTFSSGQNTVTFNTVAGSSDYNIASGTNFRGPRWYKLLSISGQQATTATPIVFVTRIEPDKSSASDFNQRHVIGTTHQPTATVTNDINGAGAGWQINSGGTTIQMGAWTRSAVNLTSNSLNQRQVMASLRGFESLGAPSFLNLRSSNVCVGTGARNSNATAIGGAGANLYVMVALGTANNTAGTTAGDQAIFKASFVATSYTGI